jgi:hypothetical protein
MRSASHCGDSTIRFGESRDHLLGAGVEGASVVMLSPFCTSHQR